MFEWIETLMQAIGSGVAVAFLTIVATLTAKAVHGLIRRKD